MSRVGGRDHPLSGLVTERTMSRIGKQPITIPGGVDVSLDGQHVTVKGPKGTLEHDVPETITVSRDGDTLLVTRPDDERQNRALHGLTL